MPVSSNESSPRGAPVSAGSIVPASGPYWSDDLMDFP